MSEKKDYLVSVKGELTVEEFGTFGIKEVDVKHKFKFSDMYLITLGEDQAEQLEACEKVKYVEVDKDVSTPENGYGNNK